MRVRFRERTRDRLVFQLRPVKLAAYYGFGVLFAVLGVFAAYLLGRATEFRCEREGALAGRCVYRHAVLAWSRREEMSLGSVRGARVDVTQKLLYGTMTLVANTDSGDLRLDLVAADGREKDSLAAETNRFLNDEAVAAISIREDYRVLGLAFGLFLVAAGAVCILAIERIVCVFDRERGKVSIRSRSPLGPRRVDLPLERVREVTTESFVVRGAESWNVLLALDRGQSVSLATTPLFTTRSADEVCQAITEFLRGG